MRTLTITLAAALLAAAPVAAQTSALSVGGSRATIRIQANLTIPAYLRAAESQALTETWQGNGYTEYVATYTVRGNVRWDLVSSAMPEGVTLLAQDGEWTTGAATIGNGEVTNGATVLVRVRVATGTAADWRQHLQLEAVRRS